MELLLLVVLSGHVIEGRLRNKNADNCYANAKTLGKELSYVVLNPP